MPSGRTSATTWEMPTLRAIAPAVRWLSPVIMAVSSPKSLNRIAPPSPLQRVCYGYDAGNGAVDGPLSSPSSLLLPDPEVVLPPGIYAFIFHEPPAARSARVCPQLALPRLSGYGNKLLGRLQRDRDPQRSSHGRAEWMFRSALNAGGQQSTSFSDKEICSAFDCAVPSPDALSPPHR